MSNENKGRQMLYQSSPAVAALNKVPGFDPLKLLRRTVSEKTQEPMFRLDLPYKKLWFRLANPQGSIRVNALRVTEQMAVYEAQVFLNREDAQPLVAFTASCTKDDAPNGRYIEAAQWAAINEALTDAGYGLQFADITMRPEDRRYGSDLPLDVAQKMAKNAAAAKEQPVQTQTTPAQKAQSTQVQVTPTQQPESAAAATVQKEQPAPVAQQPAVAQATNAVPMLQPEPGQAPAKVPQAEAVEPTQPAPIPAPVNQPASEEPVKQPAPALTVEQAKPEPPAAVDMETVQTKTEPQPAAVASAYSPETPVDEILKTLTLEQAMDVKVDSGLCKDWTLREVVEKRPVSLRFYVFGKCKNNLVRAAAKLVLDSLEQQKAG